MLGVESHLSTSLLEVKGAEETGYECSAQSQIEWTIHEVGNGEDVT